MKKADILLMVGEWKTIVPIIGVVGAIGIGAYAVTRLITPPCAQGSACSNAIAPYVDAWQICANEYASELQNDIKNGIDPSSDSNLTYLTQCMNSNAATIAKTAQGFNYNALAVVETWGETVIEGAFVAIGIYAFFKAGGAGYIGTAIRSGAGAANKLLQTIVRYFTSSGGISSSQASALVQQLPTLQDSLTSYDTSLLDSLSSEGIITAEEAINAISEDTTNIIADFTSTIDELEVLV
jgi:hypothetical protein